MDADEHVSFATWPTPCYIGDVIKDERKFIARTAEALAKSGIDVKPQARLMSIRSDQHTVELSDGQEVPCDYLVMATGANCA